MPVILLSAPLSRLARNTSGGASTPYAHARPAGALTGGYLSVVLEQVVLFKAVEDRVVVELDGVLVVVDKALVDLNDSSALSLGGTVSGNLRAFPAPRGSANTNTHAARAPVRARGQLAFLALCARITPARLTHCG